MRLSVLVCFLICSGVLAEDDLIVKIKQGKVRGHRLVTRKGREFLAFQGIPYAKPPLGELRFKRSLPADNWEGVRDATKEGTECVQKDFYNPGTDVTGKEDCLTINVYTPKLKTDSLLPVMVWIHGGDWFSMSSSSRLFGGNFLLDKDVVYVNFNYRIGPLGFLSTGDDVCPGNNGLKDQVLALQWVKDNIAKFSGNPDRVTLFGGSSGGASVHYHTLSPLSKGLFHGAIAHSGVAISSFTFSNSKVALNYAKKLSTRLNCPTKSSVEMIECLRQIKAEDMIDQSDLREVNEFPVALFRPVQESGVDAFLPDNPRVLLHNPESVANVPFMVGVTSSEGGICAASIFGTPHLRQEFCNNFNKMAPICLMYRETSPHPDDVTQKIKKFYFENKPITNDSLDAVVDVISDIFINFPTLESVRLQVAASSAPVFLYYFDYKPPVSGTTQVGDGTCVVKGAAHNDDLQFLFPHNYMTPDGKLTSEKDLKMIETMLTMWTNFARTGNPTPAEHHDVYWNPVKSVEIEYLHIGREGQVMMSHSLLDERMNFVASLPLAGLHVPAGRKDEL